MAEYDLFRVSSDGKVGEIARRLATSHDHDGLIVAELLTRLELRRMHNRGYILSPWQVRNIRNGMDTGAHGDGVTFPLNGLSVWRLISDHMFAGIPSPY